MTFSAKDEVQVDPQLQAEDVAKAYQAQRTLEQDAFWSRCRAPKSLALKTGAQVPRPAPSAA